MSTPYLHEGLVLVDIELPFRRSFPSQMFEEESRECGQGDGLEDEQL